MKAIVLGLDGGRRGEVELPEQFNEEYRPDIIRRAYHAEATARLQPKGIFLLAGLQTTARYYGRRHAWRQTINTGRSRLPREKIPGGGTGRVRIVPHARSGRRAHPPKAEKNLRERINFKENNKAIRSALAATANATLVKARGHVFERAAPIVVENALEEIKRTKDAKRVLSALGVKGDLERAESARKKRSGRARLRKGGYRTPKSVLIVFGEDKGIWHAVRNLPGVDACRVDKLNAELLAPGGDAGRLAILTENAVARLKENGLFS